MYLICFFILGMLASITLVAKFHPTYLLMPLTCKISVFNRVYCTACNNFNSIQCDWFALCFLLFPPSFFSCTGSVNAEIWLVTTLQQISHPPWPPWGIYGICELFIQWLPNLPVLFRSSLVINVLLQEFEPQLIIWAHRKCIWWASESKRNVWYFP